MIPKNIYQTWNNKNLPPVTKSVVEKMCSINKGYSHYIFDDREVDEFVKNNYSKQVYKIYNSLKIQVAKIDLWRYMFLYKNGGIYIDIDSTILKPLDELIEKNDSAIISRENNPGLFVQWCLMFEPEHPLLEAVLMKALENVQTKASNSVVELTGPNVFSTVLKDTFPDIDIYNGKDEEINALTNSKNSTQRVRIFSYDYGDFCQWKVHEIDSELHKDRIHWRDELQIKGLFKDEE